MHPSTRFVAYPAIVVALFLVSTRGDALPAAPGTPSVAVEVRVEREQVRIAADGRAVTYREPVQNASPGDVLVYTIRTLNVGDRPALHTNVEDPVPQGTILDPASVSTDGATVAASLDGGKSWQAFPAHLSVRQEDGTVREVLAPATSYTHLRWTFHDPLAPGDEREVLFKVRIQGATSHVAARPATPEMGNSTREVKR